MNVAKKDKKSKGPARSREQMSGCEKKSKKPSGDQTTTDDAATKERRKNKTARNRKNRDPNKELKEQTKTVQRGKSGVSKELNVHGSQTSNIHSAETADASSANTMRTPSDEQSTDKKRVLPSSKEVNHMSDKEPIRVAKVAPKKKKKSKPKSKPKESAESSDGRKFNMMLAQLFFKQMMEQRKALKSPITNDEMLETMPAKHDVVISARTMKRHRENHRRTAIPLDREVFKPNGEPVWMFPERKPSEAVEIEEGVKTRFPELMLALAEDDIKIDDGKQWLSLIDDFAGGKFNDGILEELPEFDPFLPFEELAERTELYYRLVTVQYYTMKNMCILCKVALDRFDAVPEMETADRRRLKAEQLRAAKEQEEKEMEKTAVVTSISFNMANTFSISYDRRRPILSIQKFRRKYEAKLRVSNEGSREKGSREKGSREKA